MKKKLLAKFFITFVSFIILLSITIIYLNRVVLPTKIKSLIIQALQEQTQKKVSLESVKFNIFKGLVLKNLVIYDGLNKIIALKEGSCTVLIFPFFKKQIIIPSIRLVNPVIFLERRQDNTFNLQELFPKKSAKEKKQKFNLIFYKVSIKNGYINFQDNTLAPIFTKTIDNLNLVVRLSLPATVKLDLKLEIPANPKTKLTARAQYWIPKQHGIARIDIQDLSPKEFLGYFRGSGLSMPGGAINASIKINFMNNILNADLDAKARDFVILKDKITGSLNSSLDASLQYHLANKQLEYSGNMDILAADISGLEFVDRIRDIKGGVRFGNSGLSSDNLTGNCLGIPIEVKFELTDFNNPLLNATILSNPDLNYLKGILKKRFGIEAPASIQGKGKLSLVLVTKIPSTEPPQINGYLDLLGAAIKFEKLKNPIDNIIGRLEFSQNQLQWSGLNFKFLDIAYKTSGTLTNFKAPGLQFDLSSQDIHLESILAIKDKIVRLSKCQGRYINSDFSLKGNIDATETNNVVADLAGALNLELNDLKVPLKKFEKQLEKLAPSGIVQGELNLSGNINDIKSCAIKAKFTSPEVSFYGLKGQDFSLDYNQADGLADIPLLHLSLYDGSLDASAKMNLSTQNLPYWLSLNIQNVKLEKLKLDTTARKKDLSGTIQAQAKINGYSGDLDKINGAGQISITDGRLWELNLFQGLGSLLFTKDFTSIVFSKGYCAFIIQDKYIFTDSLILNSNLADLSGTVKIGFDSSIDASLDVHVLDEAPLSGTFKDITTAIMGRAGRFGVIKIGGTLKEPKYKFKTAVTDIIKGLKDIFFKK